MRDGPPGGASAPRWPRQGMAADTLAAVARVQQPEIAGVVLAVYRALQERGYDPVGQLAQYLLSGEPPHITAHRGARVLITRVERDEILAELVRVYLSGAASAP